MEKKHIIGYNTIFNHKHQKLNMNQDIKMQFEGSTNTDYIENPEQTQTNEQYNNTPIWLRGNQESGYYGTLGDYRITEPYQDIEHLKEDINNIDINIMMNIIATMIDATFKLKELNK